MWAENLFEIGKNWEFENQFTNKATSSVKTTVSTPEIQVYRCAINYNICKNDGQCLLINGTNIICRCPAGYSGI